MIRQHSLAPRAWRGSAVALVALVVLPLVVSDRTISLGFVAVQYAVFALGLNIVVGWAGLLDLGASGFVAVGAYAAAITLSAWGVGTPVALVASIVAGFVAGVVLGVPTLRHRLDYFAILTLGFAELVSLGIRNWPAVTHGSYGYSGIPPTTLPFMSTPLRAVPPLGFYYLGLGILVLGFAIVAWVRATAWGRALHIIKHSEVVAQAYGIDVLRAKLLAFGASAAFLGAGGFLWAVYQRSIVWTEFGVLLSCLLLSLLIVGGLGNPVGVAVGAALVGTSQELIRRGLTWSGWPQNIRFLAFAILLILFLHLRPAGIVPDRPTWFRRASHRRTSLPHQRLPRSSVPVLELRDVRKAFGGLVAVNGVSLSVAAGECIALVGPNGCGKTTLLNLANGLLRPDQGAIRLEGRRVDRLPSFAIARGGVGRSFQEISVFDDLSAGDNVFVTSGDMGASEAEVCRLLAEFGIADPEVSAEQLSYGARKALDMARLFLHAGRLRVALLDEPTAGLTQREASDVVRSLARLRTATKISLLVVSHDIMFLEQLGVDRVVVMQHGKVFREGSFDSIRADLGVRRLFWGDAEPA